MESFWGNFEGGAVVEVERRSPLAKRGPFSVIEESFAIFRCPGCKKTWGISWDQFYGRAEIDCPNCRYNSKRNWSGGVAMKGCVGLCSKGSLGLITSDTRQEVTYGDGTKGMAFVGIHLTDKFRKVGDPWSSRDPRIVRTPAELSELIKNVTALGY